MPEYFATKYDSAAAEIIAHLADETEGFGQRDDATGNVDAPTGHVALVIIPEDVDLNTDDEWDLSSTVAREYGVTADDVAGVHIVTTNDLGFVSVSTYPTEADARFVFDQIADEYSEWIGHDEY